MKANAPKKIYTNENGNNPLLKRHCDSDIEYTRTDAFIEKACVWLNNNFMGHDEYGVISAQFDTKEEMFEDFKNYMKGE